ncbi:hypothetical protein GUITHDRAFT_105968 [Guillardia theta CCMP2712]|uniref:Putative zinc-finger domain-containing protein n=1 Tax=Guillardia theta (strain CCMP2712) TaxID=905079 RepID=L1JJV4_GUITC|nr:hypothetical protein GUITHDRAFT_105968 [Guillardia theta CCMP2712]EKX48360.1 hypothetical protein GUITHDRAFT_105968 [Guillardia theta CCMP2712]|eukprot:XP_005835340.1 hypothetical protein GUITHDRAFT_105968 [Guillardia theta CCMP2712]
MDRLEIIHSIKHRMQEQGAESNLDVVNGERPVTNKDKEIENLEIKLAQLQSICPQKSEDDHGQDSLELNCTNAQQELQDDDLRVKRRRLNPMLFLCKFDLHGRCDDPNCKDVHVRDSLAEHSRSKANDNEPELKASAPAVGEQASDLEDASTPATHGDHSVSHLESCPRDDDYISLVNEGDETPAGDGGTDDEPVVEALLQRWKPASQDLSMDSRYFGHFQELKELRARSLKHPSDIHSWIRAARLLLEGATDTDTQVNNDMNLRVDLALNTLSHALDHNPTSVALWLLYLDILEKKSSGESRELLMHAVRLNPASWLLWHRFAQSQDGGSARAHTFLTAAEKAMGESEGCNGEEKERWQSLWADLLLGAAHQHCQLGNAAEAMGVLRESTSKHASQSEVPLAIQETLWRAQIHIALFGVLPDRIHCMLGATASKGSLTGRAMCPTTGLNSLACRKLVHTGSEEDTVMRVYLKRQVEASEVFLLFEEAFLSLGARRDRLALPLSLPPPGLATDYVAMMRMFVGPRGEVAARRRILQPVVRWLSSAGNAEDGKTLMACGEVVCAIATSRSCDGIISRAKKQRSQRALLFLHEEAPKLTPLDDPRWLDGLEHAQLEERYLCFGRDYEAFNETLSVFLEELERSSSREEHRDFLLAASSKHPANHRLCLLTARVCMAEGDWRQAQRILSPVKSLLESHDEL